MVVGNEVSGGLSTGPPGVLTTPLRLLVVEATDDDAWTLTTLDLAFPEL